MSSSTDAVARRERDRRKVAEKKKARLAREAKFAKLFDQLLKEQERAETLLAKGEAEAERIRDAAEREALRAIETSKVQVEDAKLAQAKIVAQFQDEGEPLEGIASYLELDVKEVRSLLKIAKAAIRQQSGSPAPITDADQGEVAPDGLPSVGEESAA